MLLFSGLEKKPIFKDLSFEAEKVENVESLGLIDAALIPNVFQLALKFLDDVLRGNSL